ncbi:hypothetical protein D3C73_1166950 [compost metagenome]
MPAISAANKRCTRKPCTSVKTSSYCGSACMWPGSPCMCISTTGTPVSAAASNAPSWRRPKMSLIIPAPAATAARITSGLKVSMLIGTAVRAASCSMTGTTRRSSSSIDTGAAPGRVDSPPMSSRSAPSSTSFRPCATAASVVSWAPPSENESGVTLTIPMTRARSRRRMRPAQSSWGEISNMADPAGNEA